MTLEIQPISSGLSLSMNGNDQYTKMLLHCNGADTSTTFTDSARIGTAKTVTANGNAQVDTAQSKFGGASGLFDGTGDYLSIPTSSDFDFASGDFTIDFWVRPNALSGHEGLTSINNVALTSGGFFMEFDNAGAPSAPLRVFVTYTDATTTDTYATGGFSTGTWYHIAFVRSGSNFYIFVDGVQKATWSSAKQLKDAPNGMVIGRLYTDSAGNFNGWIDEFRVTKGYARWTAAFTPPTRAYGDS